MVRIVWVLLLVLLTGAGGVAAQETKRLEPVVVTATKTETPAAELGASVSVVGEDDLRLYHYATVDEALRHVPGVEIRRSGSLGKTSSLTIRGANANQIQVLVDGVRVKGTTTGQADLSDLSPDLIERIEVIRGPQSTLYGADAIGGVINIITKKGRGPFAARVEQEAGSYDTHASRATLGGSWRLLDYSLSGSHLESNGQFRNDDSTQEAVNGRLGLALPWDSRVDVTARWNRTETGLPVKFLSTNFGPLPIVPVIDVNNRQSSDTSVLGLSARTRPVRWWESQVRLGRYENVLRFTDLPDPADGCPFGAPCEFPSRISVERREAEWLNHVHLGTWSTSSLGLEYRHEEGDNRSSTPFASRSWTRAAFFQQQLRFFDRLFMSAGVRVEDNSIFGTSTTERGSLAYVVKAWGTRLRGGAGSGFRAPTFNEQFFPGFSDPTLKPEESFSYELGVDQKLWEGRLRLGLTYFQTNYDNLIALLSTPTFPFVRGVNAGRSRAAGIEFIAEADLLDTLVASLNYTYTDTETLATDRPFPREPRHRWNLTLTWEPVKKLSLFTQLHVVTRQLESAAAGYNRGHTRVDVGGSWRLLERWTHVQALDLTARIQNLLDEGYAEVRGFPALGIHGLVGLRATF
ncbi:MAG: hypothetical protein A3G44_14180 [Candidatus Rokubacteria bacterium RIFCSPLOWO2_12_FULL_73_47]|nr:MAG: hypothetical protein A3G44_14180 [Candidatus Rokubacteria bacterium RIFCSPLOWO2_12_FULL_73_47]